MTEDDAAWQEYGAESVRDFLKHYTDGDVGHGGRRFRCPECDAEYRSPVDAATHATGFEYAPPCDIQDVVDEDDWQAVDVGEHFDVLEFDADGRRVIP